MRVLLIHGLGRTPLSLLGLARELRRDGHHPQLVAYVGAVESYTAIVHRVRTRLQAAARTGEPYAAVGHSEKDLTLSTLRNIADAELAEGLASADELQETIAALADHTEDPRSILGCPRIFQVWGRKR